MGLFLCVFSFGCSLIAGRHSRVAGLGSVLTTGYLYGIVRANYLDSYTHFIFDSAVLGFYLGFVGYKPDPGTYTRSKPLRAWTIALIGWPCVMALLPIQHYLIQLVGLRGNAYLVPFLLIGGWLKDWEADQLVIWIAVLNLVAFGFGLAEFFFGVPLFFPLNPVTELIYRSNAVEGKTLLRIPACFSNAHGYAGTMLLSIPWLAGAWLQRGRPLWHQWLMATTIGVAILGIFMAAARAPVVILSVLVVAVIILGRLRAKQWIGWALLLVGTAYMVSKEERLQRFTSLQDPDAVIERIQGSVSLSFVGIIASYPMGNGMGGGGTSIPYFWQGLLTNRIAIENEFSRILLEQGFPGLLLWVGFIVWFANQWPTEPRRPWLLGQRLLWLTCMVSFLSSVIGMGMMTSIPGTMLMFLAAGFSTRRNWPMRRREKNLITSSSRYS